MALLDILGSLASFAQGDIGGGISGLKQNALHGKEEADKNTKKDMANQLIQSPDNQALFAKADPSTQTYVQNAIKEGKYDEVQQVIAQEKKKNQVGTNREAVGKLLGPLAMQANATPEEAQAAQALLSSDNPFSAVHYLGGVNNRNRTLSNQARVAQNQKDSAAGQLATSQEAAAKYDKALLEQGADPQVKHIYDIQQNLSNFKPEDINLDPKVFASRYKLSATDAKAVQGQLKDAAPGFVESKLREYLSPLSGGLIAPPQNPTGADLVSHVVSQNVSPEQLQQEAARRQSISAKEDEVRAASTAKQALLQSRAGASDTMIRVQASDGRTGQMPLSKFDKAKKADPGLKVIR